MCRRLALVLVSIAGCGRFDFDVQRGPLDSGGSSCAPDAAVDAPSTPTFYVGTTGSDSNPGTMTAPWATFAHAYTVIGPGDTLVILDGTYTEPLNLQKPGMPGMPITVRAEHDGKVIIDGRNQTYPCNIRGNLGANTHDLVVEGLSCRNPLETAQNGEAALLVYYADRVTVRRCTATGATDVEIEVVVASDILLEDVAAWGNAHYGLTTLQTSRVTVRRAFIQWQAGAGDAAMFNITETADGLFENNVLVNAAGTAGAWGGIQIYSDSMSTDRNRVLGNVVIGHGLNHSYWLGGNLIDITSNRFADNVAILDNGVGFFQRGDIDLVVDRFTVVSPDPGVLLTAEGTNNLKMTALTSSVFLGTSTGLDEVADARVLGFSHDHNVFFNVPTLYAGTTAGAGEVTLDPGYDTARYGNGAYLLRPPALAALGASGPAGAEILYRTVDGALTTTPLWPWPLEARIVAESGLSPTSTLWTTLPPYPPGTSCTP